MSSCGLLSCLLRPSCPALAFLSRRPGTGWKSPWNGFFWSWSWLSAWPPTWNRLASHAAARNAPSQPLDDPSWIKRSMSDDTATRQESKTPNARVHNTVSDRVMPSRHLGFGSTSSPFGGGTTTGGGLFGNTSSGFGSSGGTCPGDLLFFLEPGLSTSWERSLHPQISLPPGP